MRKLVVFLLPKYLRFDKTQPFISITAILAFLGVGIGVMVLCVAMAIMNGMTKEFERKLFVMNYPLSVYSITYKGVRRFCRACGRNSRILSLVRICDTMP